MAHYSNLFLSSTKPRRAESAQGAPMQHISTARNDGSEYINNEVTVLPWEELVASFGKRDSYLFIKPVDDHKAFTRNA